MTFPYPLFPVSMAFGFMSDFDYGNGELMVLNSGAVVSGPIRAAAQRNFEFSYNIRDYTDVVTIRDHMHDARVSKTPVLIRDWADYQATNESFGTGDGTTDAKPLYKWYGTLDPVSRQIKYPETTDLVVYENGVVKAIASSSSAGVVPADPWAMYATLTWTGTFYVPVRLTSRGSIEISGPGNSYASVPRLSAIEDLSA